MTQTIDLQRTGYPFAEMLEVSDNATASMHIWEIPKNTLVERVVTRIKTAGGTAASNLTIGDATDADGWIVATSAKGTAGTIVGDAYSEVGAYQMIAQSSTGATVSVWNPPGKFYTSEGNYLTLALSAAQAATTLVLQVFIFGHRFGKIA